MLDGDMPMRMAWPFFFSIRFFRVCCIFRADSRFIYQVDNNTADRQRDIQKKIDENDEALKNNNNKIQHDKLKRTD